MVWLSWLRTATPAYPLETALRLMQENGWTVVSVSVLQSLREYTTLEAFVTLRRPQPHGGSRDERGRSALDG